MTSERGGKNSRSDSDLESSSSPSTSPHVLSTFSLAEFRLPPRCIVGTLVAIVSASPAAAAQPEAPHDGLKKTLKKLGRKKKGSRKRESICITEGIKTAWLLLSSSPRSVAALCRDEKQRCALILAGGGVLGGTKEILKLLQLASRKDGIYFSSRLVLCLGGTRS